jgi:hypothetical protein
MDPISDIVSNVVSQATGKDDAQVTEELTASLAEAGHSPLKVVKTGNIDKRQNDSCASGIEACEEYKVDHGDGTFSDPWWGPWFCF